MCRAVVVTGLPFAPYLDPKVKLKRDFLDTARASERTRPSAGDGFGDQKSTSNTRKPITTLSGAEWYNQQAHRAVNQAIGRVIRHKNDYGSVLFLDHRFAEDKNRDGLSKWLRPYLRNESFGASTRCMVQFYRAAKAKADASRARPILQYEDTTHGSVKDTQQSDAQITKIAVVTSIVDEGDGTNTFIPESHIQKRIDLNEPSIKEELPSLEKSDSTYNKESSTSTLAQAYSKRKQPEAAVIRSNETPLIDTQPIHNRQAKPISSRSAPVKAQSFVPGKKDDAKQLAKVFFETAKQVLRREDLLKTQQLLVTMKNQGGKICLLIKYYQNVVI